jgi:hypothetical protein
MYDAPHESFKLDMRKTNFPLMRPTGSLTEAMGGGYQFKNPWRKGNLLQI